MFNGWGIADVVDGIGVVVFQRKEAGLVLLCVGADVFQCEN